MNRILLWVLILALNSVAQSAEIVFTERRDADSFKRISEHFTGTENPGRYAIARSNPNERNGFYIAIKLDESDRSESIASVRIQFVRPQALEIESHTLPINPVEKHRALIGLTDGLWATSNEVPNAWKIEFLDSQGNLVSQIKSFLWNLDKAPTNDGES